MEQKTCETCGSTFTPKTNTRAGRFCSLPCYYAIGPRGPRVEKENRKTPQMVTLQDHPLSPPSGVLSVSRVVLYEEIGIGPHSCHWCGGVVNWETGLVPGALIVDHLDWDIHNNTPENLVASCLNCNAHRRETGKANLIADGELVVEVRPGNRTRAIQRNCEYCGKPFLAVPARVKQGRGRFCSKDCMYNRNKPKPPDMSGVR